MAVYYVSGCPCCGCCGSLQLQSFGYYDNDPDSPTLEADNIGNWTWYSEDLETFWTELYVNYTTRLTGIPQTHPKNTPLPAVIESAVINDVTFRIGCGDIVLAAGTKIYWSLNNVTELYDMRPIIVCQ